MGVILEMGLDLCQKKERERENHEDKNGEEDCDCANLYYKANQSVQNNHKVPHWHA